MPPSFSDEARELISRMSNPNSGSMSPSIYDTAWLSIIPSQVSPETWLFPECFEFVLNSQLETGGWHSYASHVDGILNTSAALLSLKLHLHHDKYHSDWIHRSQKAQKALKDMLLNWDVASTDQVGFEILTVKLLTMLEAEGVDVTFPQYEKLRSVYHKKLGQLPASGVYEAPSTLYHSLEALIGHVDFVRLKRWQEPNGSMMGSPSSTAAYLMYSTEWDHDAECYLRTVLEHGPGQGNGSVPSAWPTSIFESAWIVSTLAAAGFTINETEFSAVRSFLEKSLHDGKGVVGFSPSSLPDSDDTAKTLLALHYLGRNHDIDPLLRYFEADDHFLTYPGERNPSFSANCNVLVSLLILGDPKSHIPQVMKAIRFIYTRFVSDCIQEKWHTHSLYSLMLLAQAIKVLHEQLQDSSRWAGTLCQDPVLMEQTAMISLHILSQVLESQEPNGSWSNIYETTAYAILILSSLLHLPWVRSVAKATVMARIQHGRFFLKEHRKQWKNGEYLWIEKVTYASDVLSEAYSLAAMIAAVEPKDPRARSELLSLPQGVNSAIKRAGSLLGQTILFSSFDQQLLHAAEIQACYAFQHLEKRRLDIFPRTSMGKDRYLSFIPLTWTACSMRRGGPVSLDVLKDMMILSMLNYQVDEYMEIVVGWDFTGDFRQVRHLIKSLCFTHSLALKTDNTRMDEDPISTSQKTASDGNRTVLDEIKLVLGRYISYILQHPAVVSCPADIQTRLAAEVQTFLLAHVTHAVDNRRLQRQQTATCQSSPWVPLVDSAPLACFNPGQSFYKWVNSVSADNTSCPFSFVFFNCLLGPSCREVWENVQTAYVAEDMTRHLANLCRMYNDYGSMSRDRDECNLNSVDFPEFHISADDGHLPAEDITQRVKSKLMEVAEYERRALNQAFQELENTVGSGKFINAVKLFIDVTDLYGQIYVQRDIATPMRSNGKKE